MLLQNWVERVLNFADLGDGEPNYLAFVDPQIGWANGDLLSRDVVVDKSLDDFSETALDAGHEREV